MEGHDQSAIGFEIRTLSNLIRRHIDKSTTRAEVESITGMNGWVIVYLAHNLDRDVFQRDLEERFTVRRSTMSNILALMEKKELIRRESVECDARLKKLVLTERSFALLEKMEKDRTETERIITEGISESELTAFLAIAEKMRKNLEKCDGECTAEPGKPHGKECVR